MSDIVSASEIEKLVTGFCVQYLHHHYKDIIRCIIFGYNGNEGIQISHIIISANYMNSNGSIAIASKLPQRITVKLTDLPDVINYFISVNPTVKEFCNTMKTRHSAYIGVAKIAYKYLTNIHQNPEGKCAVNNYS
eukprot:850331_1